jgi:pimeloyl-ACP methyl ester carboxylesterase
LTVEQITAEIEADAEIIRTPCADGDVVWRCWGTGPPVVLLHGGYGSWLHWLRNVRPLSQRFAVIVPDMPGFGDSASPPEPYSPTSLATILAIGLNRLLGDETAFDLVGFSFGGTVAGEVALASPFNVRRLVIVGTSSLAPPGGPRPEPLEWRTAENPQSIHRENLRRLMIADPGRIDDLAVHIQRVNTSKARVASRRFRSHRLLNRALPLLKMPRAGIWGGEDAMGRHGLDAIETAIRSLDPLSAFEVVPGAGHWVCFEQPELFNSTLVKILGSPAAI